MLVLVLHLLHAGMTFLLGYPVFVKGGGGNEGCAG